MSPFSFKSTTTVSTANAADSVAKSTKAFPGGGRYEGQFSGTQREGYGVFQFPNGDVYSGYWKNDRKSGFGSAEFADGQKYEGTWDNGMKNGKGVFYFNGGNVYDGEWKDDRKEGHGCAQFASGNRYEGSWKADSMCGKGTFYYANGDVYSGDWKDNKKHGVGVWRSQNGVDQYEGEWEGDMRHGSGIMKYQDQQYSVRYTQGRLEACYPLADGPDSPVCTGTELAQQFEAALVGKALQSKSPVACAAECKANAPHLPLSLKSEAVDERIVICVM